MSYPQNSSETFYKNKQPSTYDALRPNGFKFSVNRLPNVNYFCQRANIPELSITPVAVNNRLATLPVAGDKLQFEPLQVTFLVAEDMSNYIELANWLFAMGPRKDVSSYADYNKPLHSNGSLIVLNSANRPTVNINFYDMLPVSLAGMEFDITVQSPQYLTAVATFQYSYYEILPL